jgi:hypothetical protein
MIFKGAYSKTRQGLRGYSRASPTMAARSGGILSSLFCCARCKCDANGDLAKEMAAQYVTAGGLPPRAKVDAIHIANATLAKCDIIASWNFKHVANMRAIKAVEAVNAERGFSRLEIYSPQSLIEFKEDGGNG